MSPKESYYVGNYPINNYNQKNYDKKQQRQKPYYKNRHGNTKKNDFEDDNILTQTLEKNIR
jgi:hypothetical protein